MSSRSLERRIVESPRTMGTREKKTYSLTVPSSWGSTPSAGTIAIYDITTGTEVDVTSAMTSGTPTISGSVITLPQINAAGGTANHTYYVDVEWVAGSDRNVAWMELKLE